MLMQCFIYRSLKKNGLYVYMPKKDDFEKIPEGIMAQLGEIEFAMKIELTKDKKLAKEDPVKVIENIEINGFHLQMPSDIEDILNNISKQLK